MSHNMLYRPFNAISTNWTFGFSTFKSQVERSKVTAMNFVTFINPIVVTNVTLSLWLCLFCGLYF